jgi:hypothetical protein
VLKPGGLAYISEPVSAGAFNEILNLFNDDRAERKAAFAAVKGAVDAGMFTLVEQVFFNTPRRYENFADFENRIINSSHSHHSLDEDLLRRVRSRFEAYAGEDGATFWSPVRVDLIRKQSFSSR